jgi:hypothetical protein
VPALAALHGRLLVLDREAAPESTGHGSPLPVLKHGGPGRAGGGEELGGLRAVTHYLQRAAVQGSPTMLTAVTANTCAARKVIETGVHPFRRHFEDLQIGESLLTAPPHRGRGRHRARLRRHLRRLLLHALRRRGRQGLALRPAHRARLLRAVGAAGLFVVPAPGPVLANYGLDTLRFVKPVAIGDTIQARLTCKRKIDRNKKASTPRAWKGQGVVAWDVEVTNQHGELVIRQLRHPDAGGQEGLKTLAFAFHDPQAGVVERVFGQMRHGDHAGKHRMVVRHVGAAGLAVFQFHGQRVLELPEVAQAGRVVERGRVRRQEVVQDVPVDGLEQAVGPGELGLEDLKDLLRLFGVHDFWAVVGDAGLDNGLHVQTGPALEIQQGAERIHILAGDEIDGLAVSGIQSRQLADDVLKRTVNVLVVECHGWGFLVPGGA